MVLLIGVEVDGIGPAVERDVGGGKRVELGS